MCIIAYHTNNPLNGVTRSSRLPCPCPLFPDSWAAVTFGGISVESGMSWTERAPNSVGWAGRGMICLKVWDGLGARVDEMRKGSWSQLDSLRSSSSGQKGRPSEQKSPLRLDFPRLPHQRNHTKSNCIAIIDWLAGLRGAMGVHVGKQCSTRLV